MLIVNGVKYLPWKPTDEERQFHPMVRSHSKEIFGEDSLYFDVKHILKGSSGIGSIPDAYVIDLSTNEWYVVENELSTHPIYDHIVKQLTKFINGIENQKTRNQIIEMIYDQINANNQIRETVQKATGSTDIYRYLSRLLNQTPRIAVIIDEKGSDIEDACRALKYEPFIVEFKTFVSENDPNMRAHLFEPPSQRTEIAEKGKMSQAAYKAWETRQSQTWDKKIESASEEIKTIVKELERRILNLGKISSLQRTRKAYYKGKKALTNCFAVVEIAEDGLVVRIDTNPATFRDPEKWSISGVRKGMFFTNQSKFKISNIEQIDYAMSLIKQAYDIAEGK